MSVQSFENQLNDIFTKHLPPLPASSRRALVQYLPWINLVLGLLSLYTVYAVWHWAHLANDLLNYAYNISGSSAVNRLSFGVWLGLAVLVIEAVLYLLAFRPARERRRFGWYLMYYALLINVVYGLLMCFTSYGGLGTLLGSLVGSSIGLYLLFQIRSSYGTRAKKA